MIRIVIRGLSGCKIFSHIISKTARLSKKVIEQEMFVMIFSTNLSETFLILRRMEWDMIKKCKLVFIGSDCYSCEKLMKTELSRQIFEKYSNIKFHENLTIGSRIFPRRRTDGQTERHDEANRQSHFAFLRKNLKIISTASALASYRAWRQTLLSPWQSAYDSLTPSRLTVIILV